MSYSSNVERWGHVVLFAVCLLPADAMVDTKIVDVYLENPYIMLISRTFHLSGTIHIPARPLLARCLVWVKIGGPDIWLLFGDDRIYVGEQFSNC